MEDLQKQLDALQQRSQDDHRELEQLLAAQAAPTFVVQRERKLRRFSGTGDPLLSDWAEEARSCILAQKLSGEAAANFLLSYLDGAARLEVRCRPSAVKKDADSILVALQDVFGDKETANQLLRRFFYRKQLPGEPIASYSHGLIDLADRLQRLEPKNSAERDLMQRDQFVENVRDVHLRWDLKRRIEEDAAVSFLALRKVALRWFDEVERATTSRVKAQVSEARAEPTDTQREFTKLWGEVAENKKLLTQVLAQQRELLTMCAGAPSNVPATPQRPYAPPPRRRYGDLECYQCHQKGYIRRHCPMASLN